MSSDDPEVRKVLTFITETDATFSHFQMDRLERFPDLHRAKRAVAVCLRLKARLKARSLKKPKTTLPIESLRERNMNVDELYAAEFEIIKHGQMGAFKDEKNIYE